MLFKVDYIINKIIRIFCELAANSNRVEYLKKGDYVTDYMYY